MNKRSYELYITDILQSMERIENYISNMGYDEFIQNILVRDAVLRNLEVIGEAAKNIPEDIREKYPDVP